MSDLITPQGITIPTADTPSTPADSGGLWGSLGSFFSSLGESIGVVANTPAAAGSTTTIGQASTQGIFKWLFPSAVTTSKGVVPVQTFWQKYGRVLMIGGVVIVAVVFIWKRRKRG